MVLLLRLARRETAGISRLTIFFPLFLRWMTRQKAAHQDGVSPTNNEFFLWGLKVTDGWASRVFFGLVLGVQGCRHKANGVLGHDTSSALAMGFTVGVSIIES